MIGRIVCSKAGRDKGFFMIVVGCEENGYLTVCDGKAHPLERPKRKNIKHLAFTNTYLDKNSIRTNKSLKKALNEYRAVLCDKKEETACRKRT